MLYLISRFFEPWKRRILNMVAKAVINRIDDSGDIQTLKITILKDETLDEVPRVQEFGFTSNPPVDSEAAVCFVGGNQQNGIVLGVDSSQYRIKNLPSGAVAVYNQNGDYVKLTKDKIEVHAENVELGGDGAKALVNEEFKNIFDNHVHNISVAGTAAAQFGISSSPSKLAGASPLSVAALPTPTPYTFGDPVTAASLTSKTKAE